MKLRNQSKKNKKKGIENLICHIQRVEMYNSGF